MGRAGMINSSFFLTGLKTAIEAVRASQPQKDLSETKDVDFIAGTPQIESRLANKRHNKTENIRKPQISIHNPFFDDKNIEGENIPLICCLIQKGDKCNNNATNVWFTKKMEENTRNELNLCVCKSTNHKYMCNVHAELVSRAEKNREFWVNKLESSFRIEKENDPKVPPPRL